MTKFTLTGASEDLPWNIELRDADDLRSHTICAVISARKDKHGDHYGDTVFVTETGCWLNLAVEGDGCEGGSIIVRRHYGKAPATLHDVVCAMDLFLANVIGPGERDLLQKVEDDLKAIRDAKRASHLRAELKKLETAA